MKYIVIIFLAMNLSTLFAKGVPAGTVIQNSATLSFSTEEETFSIESNVDKSVVAQLIDVKVSWMDTQAVVVSAGEREKVLTYKVVNSGNSRDRFTLLADVLDYKSSFPLAKYEIYIDTNNNNRFDSSDVVRKTVYIDADKEKLIFVVSQIDEGLSATSGSQAFVNLRAISRTGGSGEKGRIHTGRGVDGVDVVDGFSGGMSGDEGAYKLLVANVVISKDVTIDEEELITVSLDVSVVGEGSVKDVNVLDIIPETTKYVSGSLQLDGVKISDQDDSDAGRYKRKYLERNAEIQMSLGELDTSSHHTITYNLTIR